MASNWDRTQRWIDRALGNADRDLGGRDASVFYCGDVIYSYGRHFAMASVMRDKAGEPRFVLINGDRYSVTTSGHQRDVRSVVDVCGLPSIIVPFAALRGSGIDPDSIEPIEIRDDRINRVPCESPTRPAGEPLTKDDPSGATRPYSVQEWTDETFTERREVTRERAVQVPDPDRVRVGRVHGPIATRGADGVWRWEREDHLLGDSLFTARALRESGRNDAGEWQSVPLWRGRRKFLSSFDYQESTPLYFLAELPRGCDAWSVEQGFEALRPESVKAAEGAGLEVTRQGDIFAIPTELTTREVKALTPHRRGRIVKRALMLGTNHSASEVMFATRDRVYARGTLRHEPGEWRTADHVRRRMGDGRTWHLLTRNTVPRQPAPNAGNRPQTSNARHQLYG